MSLSWAAKVSWIYRWRSRFAYPCYPWSVHCWTRSALSLTSGHGSEWTMGFHLCCPTNSPKAHLRITAPRHWIDFVIWCSTFLCCLIASSLLTVLYCEQALRCCPASTVDLVSCIIPKMHYGRCYLPPTSLWLLQAFYSGRELINSAVIFPVSLDTWNRDLKILLIPLLLDLNNKCYSLQVVPETSFAFWVYSYNYRIPILIYSIHIYEPYCFKIQTYQLNKSVTNTRIAIFESIKFN